MKEIELRLELEDVLAEVLKASEYCGAKAEALSAGSYERLRAVPADRDVLDEYWKGAGGDVLLAFGGWLSEVESTGDGVRYVLRVPGLWDDTQLGGLKEDLRGYYVNAILSRWYENVQYETGAASCGVRAGVYLKSMTVRLWSRRMPRRPQA